MSYSMTPFLVALAFCTWSCTSISTDSWNRPPLWQYRSLYVGVQVSVSSLTSDLTGVTSAVYLFIISLKHTIKAVACLFSEPEEFSDFITVINRKSIWNLTRKRCSQYPVPCCTRWHYNWRLTLWHGYNLIILWPWDNNLENLTNSLSSFDRLAIATELMPLVPTYLLYIFPLIVLVILMNP